MSRYITETVTCPNCGKDIHFTLWQSINTVINPEMVEKVKNGEVFNHVCKYCGEKVTIIFPMLYHKMEDNLMIYFVDENDVENTYGAFKGENSLLNRMKEKHDLEVSKLSKLIYRIVTTPERLIEKIAIFDDKLDDRIIEIMKLAFIANLEENNPDVKFDDMLYDVSETGEKRMVLTFEGRTLGSFTIVDDIYSDFADIANEWPPIEDDDIIIDLNWALERIKDAE